MVLKVQNGYAILCFAIFMF